MRMSRIPTVDVFQNVDKRFQKRRPLFVVMRGASVADRTNVGGQNEHFSLVKHGSGDKLLFRKLSYSNPRIENHLKSEKQCAGASKRLLFNVELKKYCFWAVLLQFTVQGAGKIEFCIKTCKNHTKITFNMIVQ